ncbi:MAG: zeta toxin family protein [Nitrospirota bacterium]
MQDKVVYIVAGPNGSGKTTFAKGFIEEVHLPFLNADEIAIKLSPCHIEKVRLKAGKIFLEMIKDYMVTGKSFVVETTLAGKYLVRFINELKKNDYRIELIYIFIESVEEAIHRIDIRVRKGGHPVPKEDIRRRFVRSKINFWDIYRHLVDGWNIFLNSKDEFLQVAAGEGNEIEIIDEINFSLFKEGIT